MLTPLPAHEDPEVLAHYEGLIRTTASRIDRHVEEDYDDIVQDLRIKVWRSLIAYNPAKCRTSRDAFVFSCVFNRAKDLKKKRKLGLLFIEDLAQGDGGSPGEVGQRDTFEARYLVVDPEQAFGHVEDEGIRLPSTLSTQEREIVYLLYLDFNHTEIGRQIGITRRQVDRHVQAIRTKMADWRPTPAPVAVAA